MSERLGLYDVGTRVAHLKQLEDLWQEGLKLLKSDTFRSPTAPFQIQKLEDALELLAEQIKENPMSEDAHESNIDSKDNNQSDPGSEKYLEANLAKAMRESDEAGGFFIKDLKPGARLIIRTKNTSYTLLKGDDYLELWGHEKYCPSPTKVNIHGSTFGGSVLKIGFVGRGMHLEFTRIGNAPGKVITTSTIQSIVEI